MSVDICMSTSFTALPVIARWIDGLKKTANPVLSYGICAEFAKIVCRTEYDPGLSTMIRAARKYSNGKLPHDKFTQVFEDIAMPDARGDYDSSVGMLIAAISRGNVEETINLVIFIMCFWHDKSFKTVYKGIMQVIKKVNKEVHK